MKRIYLSGASGNVSQEERNVWRNYCEDNLEKTEMFKIFNPNNSFNYENDSELSMRVIMDYYLKTIIPNCDIVLVNLNECNKSIGTALEIGYAIALNKTIIGINGQNVYPYIKDACSYVCENYFDACDFITRHFAN